MGICNCSESMAIKDTEEEVTVFVLTPQSLPTG